MTTPGRTPVSTPPEPTRLDELAASLSELGAESSTERAVRRIVPWIVSVALHAMVIVFGLLVTWTVVLLQDDDEPVTIVADFNAMQYEPVARMELPQAETTIEQVQDRVPTDTSMDALDETDFDLDALTLISNAASSSELARFAPEPVKATATFVGLSSTNARRIVYVIDASGSMIRSLSIVMAELARSLEALSSQQSFGIIFFQRNDAVVVPPRGELTPGTQREVVRMLEWIDENVIPSGRSNPLEALKQALALEPDVIFLLSENITGSGEFEIDQDELLALLDNLNPRDPEHGHRATRINCVQFLDPDPLDTLRRIADAHGGSDGYKFLSRKELGLD